jgi:site-specific recombinase XerD
VDVISPQKMQLLLAEYEVFLTGLSHRTIDAYMRIIKQLVLWIANQNHRKGEFYPTELTGAALRDYIAYLNLNGYSSTHLARVKSVVSGFSCWLMESKGILSCNPTSGLSIPYSFKEPTVELSQNTREILLSLVKRSSPIRTKAIFALGYWAGLRVGEIAWLRMSDTSVNSKFGSMKVGYKTGKERSINLIEAARLPLYEYIHLGGRNQNSPYTITSQRHERLTEAGIHRWWSNLKKQAIPSEYRLIHDVTFHDLRHDFAVRMYKEGWTLQQMACYLGHVTKDGTPSLTSVARYLE